MPRYPILSGSAVCRHKNRQKAQITTRHLIPRGIGIAATRIVERRRKRTLVLSRSINSLRGKPRHRSSRTYLRRMLLQRTAAKVIGPTTAMVVAIRYSPDQYASNAATTITTTENVHVAGQITPSPQFSRADEKGEVELAFHLPPGSYPPPGTCQNGRQDRCPAPVFVTAEPRTSSGSRCRSWRH